MLYGYQQKAVDEIRSLYARGTKKVLLHLATGGGKTHVFSHILKTSAERGKKAIMVVRGRQLVDQASQRLFKEGVRHGVRMANHWNKDFSAPIQICSIDTLSARDNFWPEADLVVIDDSRCDTMQPPLANQYTLPAERLMRVLYRSTPNMVKETLIDGKEVFVRER